MSTYIDVIAEINKNWKEDCSIDKTSIIEVTANIPNIHQKYVEIETRYSVLDEKKKRELKRFYAIKRRWYKGEMTKEELDKFKWEQFQGRITSTIAMDATLKEDSDIVQLETELGYILTIRKLLDRIISEILYNRTKQCAIIAGQINLQNGLV